jgi:UDP-glucose 4-epimerase
MADLAGARVLVTGGAGVVGSTIVDTLAPLGPAEIVVFDDFSRGLRENLAGVADADAALPLTVVEGDVRDRDALARAMQGIDVVFHEAAIRLPHCARDPRLALEVMVDGTFNVVEAAHAAGVQRFVAASSASIYGRATTFPITEEHDPYGNRTLYGAAKVFGEQLYRSYHEMFGFDYVALRYFNVYGPRMDAHTAYTEVLIRWMQRIDDGLAPLIHGAGDQTMDFVYVTDVARANVLAAASSVSDAAYNVATGVETSLVELADALLHAMGSDLDVEHGPDRDVPAVERRLAATDRAARDLGFTAEVGLAEGLAGLVAWWRARPRR